MPIRSTDAANLARALLRSRGLRATPTRIGVLVTLDRSRSPLTMVELAERLPRDDADRVTVYRTLTTLLGAGMVHRLDPGDRVFRFALVRPLRESQTAEAPHGPTTVERSAANGHGHPHLVCDSCGTVECMQDAQVVVQRPGAAELGAKGFKVTQQEVILHGTCGECAAPDRAAGLTRWKRPRKPRR